MLGPEQQRSISLTAWGNVGFCWVVATVAILVRARDATAIYYYVYADLVIGSGEAKARVLAAQLLDYDRGRHKQLPLFIDSHDGSDALRARARACVRSNMCRGVRGNKARFWLRGA